MHAATTDHLIFERHHRPVAAVDIGSNSIHLTLARIDDDGQIEVLEKQKVKTEYELDRVQKSVAFIQSGFHEPGKSK